MEKNENPIAVTIKTNTGEIFWFEKKTLRHISKMTSLKK